MTLAFENPAWFKALRLVERAVGLDEELQTPAVCNWALAERRMVKWRSQALSAPARYQERLRVSNLDHHRLLFLLGESADHLRSRVPGNTGWLSRIEAVYRQQGGPSVRTIPGRVLAEPMLAEAAAQIGVAVEREFALWNSPPCSSSVLTTQLTAGLASRLQALEQRTLLLEFNASRLRGSISAMSDQDAWVAFLAQIEPRSASLAILEEYPCLARLALGITDQWVGLVERFVRHLREDWVNLNGFFESDGAPPELRFGIQSGLGSDEGIRLRLSSAVEVEYIPYSLAAESRFDSLLDHLNELTGRRMFACRRILACDGHGWAESTVPKPPETDSERRLLSGSSGRWFALLHVFEASHIDVESLTPVGTEFVLSGPAPVFVPRLVHSTPPPSRQTIQRILDDSVLRQGLVPSLIARGKIVEHTWDEFFEGFSSTYRVLAGDAGRDLAHAYLAACAADEFRVQVRPAAIYAHHLRNLNHPDLLRDALERERYLTQLWAAIDSAPVMAKLAPFEAADLDRCAKPLFTVRPGCEGIWTSHGEHLPLPVEETAVERVGRRLVQLDEPDLDRQLWLLRALLRPPSSSPQTVSLPAPLTGSAISKDRLIRQAASICGRLNRSAVRDGERASWITLVQAGNSLSVEPAGCGLADGLSGIVLFLACFGAVTGSDEWRPLAEAALAGAMAQLDDARNQKAPLIAGVMDGMGGLLYVLPHLAQLWRRPGLLGDAEAIAGLLDGEVSILSGPGLATGMSGLVCALDGLHQFAPDGHARDIAIRLGRHLLKASVDNQQGFSAGTAGISHALLRLARLTGEEIFRDAALDALLRDRERLLTSERDWSGLTQAEPTWHDAAGAGLLRLKFLDVVEDPVLLTELAAIFDKLARVPIGSNHSLCAGDLGRLEFLRSAASALGEGEWESRAASLSAAALADIENSGPQSATAGGIELPGFGRGLAGIGYGLLHMACPAILPSVLLLESSTTSDLSRAGRIGSD